MDRTKPADSGSALVSSILAGQNADGGWGYQGGASWTEPTVCALLALQTTGCLTPRVERGIRWLRGLQRPDGGWPPQPSVDQSTWVTALAVLALGGQPRDAARDRGVAWLLGQTGRESTWVEKLRSALRGEKVETGAGTTGWPWLPGTAAWVTPTVFALLALEHAGSQVEAGAVRAREEMGRAFLLARACSGGGWNHGGARALGYAAPAYPETTGQALLALRGCQSPEVSKALARAEQFLPLSRAPQTVSWLRLGLAAHGRRTQRTEGKFRFRGVMDAALVLLADAAEGGANVFPG
ncbi:MAG TPA: prenyltransferase/squalene oxidase repeat-containing protein [Bryobacteraceae bacterium]|nr:prenyltransferase/squalene oxidase repeat-containing protein [Bryobacteraceae bacterium]